MAVANSSVIGSSPRSHKNLLSDPQSRCTFSSDITPPRVIPSRSGSSCTFGDPAEKVQQEDCTQRRYQYGPRVRSPYPLLAEDTRRKLPRRRPRIPKTIATIKRPGSGPGTIRLATNPAMAPTTIQLMVP